MITAYAPTFSAEDEHKIRERVEFIELNKTVKKKRRQRSRKKRTDHVETILQSGRGPKQTYKDRGPKKKACEMKKMKYKQTEMKY